MASIVSFDGGAFEQKVNLDQQFDPDFLHLANLLHRAGLSPGDPTRQSLDEARRTNRAYNLYCNVSLPAVGSIKNILTPGPVGKIPLRLFYPSDQPTQNLSALIYFHGGGFVLNDLDTYERIMRLLAVRARAVVIGVGYHLAPEHTYPSQLDEAESTFDFIRSSGDALGINADCIGVAGDSAGATLALSLLLRLRDQGRISTVQLALLFYGMFSNDLSSPSHCRFGRAPFNLTTEKVRWFWNAYLGATDQPSRGVPLSANLSGLPKTILVAAGLDCLLDDSRRLSAKLAEAGVEHSLTTHSRLPHSFLQATALVGAADRALTDAAHNVRNILAESRLASLGKNFNYGRK